MHYVISLNYTKKNTQTMQKHTISNFKGTRENATHTCEIRYNVLSYGRGGETRTHDSRFKRPIL